MSPQFRQTDCRLTPRRRLALGGLVLTSSLLAGVFVSGPAFADAADPITTKGALTRAFSSGQATIVLGAALTDPATPDDGSAAPADPDGVQTVPAGAHVTLDLHGNSLDLDRIVVSHDSSLAITDSTVSTSFNDGYDSAAATLTVDAERLTTGSLTAIQLASGSNLHVSKANLRVTGSDSGAGIGTGAGDATGGGTLLIDQSADVTARGGDGGAGVGGGEGAVGIATTVSGADLYARGGDGGAGIGSGRQGLDAGSLTTTQADASSNYGYLSITASGGDGAAGVGGGRDAKGGAVVQLDSRGYLNADQGSSTAADDGATASAIGAGLGGGSFGSLSIGQSAQVSLDSSSTTHLPSGVVVQNSGSISLGGSIDGDGSIANTGSIDSWGRYDGDGNPLPDTTTHIAGSVSVTGNNYSLTLDPNGGTATGSSPVHAWRAQLDTYAFPKPTAPRDDQVFFSWNTKADGTGEDAAYRDLKDLTGATSTDGIAVPLTVYAQYGRPAAFTSASLPSAALNQAYDQALPVSGDGLGYYFVQTEDDQGHEIPGLPAGLSLNSSTGHVSGVPTEAGTFTVRFSAGGDHTWAESYLKITVAGAPTFATEALPDATVGSPYSVTVQATGEGDIAYSIASGALPAGLSLTSSTGAITGTPTTAGSRGVVLRASTTFGSTLQPLVLSVAAAPTPAAAVSTSPTTPAPAASAAAAAPAAPALGSIGRTTVKFGHRLDLAVPANSTLPVSYRITSGSLPKGISLDGSTGVISGTAAEEGSFTATVSASSTAGSASTAVSITVPDIQELISTKNAVPHVKVGAGSVPLRIAGLKKGEHWTIEVDGKPVQRGTMKRAGALSATVHLKRAKKDTVHTVVIAGSRAVSDPAQQASTSVQVTSLATRKKLKVTSETDDRGVKRVVVDRLAAGERVVVKDGAKIIAKGHADAEGDFTFAQSKAGDGRSRLVVHGAAEKRIGWLTVRNPKG